MKKYMKIVKVFLTGLLLVLSFSQALAQCGNLYGNTYNECGVGEYTLSASTQGIITTNPVTHKWYTSASGTGEVTPTSTYKPTNSVFISYYKAYFNNNTTYYVSSICNGVESARVPVNVIINNPSNFVVATSPFKLTFCVGETINLTANTSHAANSYQWKMNGENVQGATTSSFSTIVSSQAQVASITVLVTTSASCVTNTSASGSMASVPFTVNEVITPSISISSNQGSSICLNTLTTFTAAITDGGSTPSYQWLINGSAASGSGNSPSFTTSDLTNGQTVSCILTNLASCATSATASSNTLAMTVYAPLTAGTVSPGAIGINYNTSPGDLTGTPATGSNGIYSYQWQISPDNATWTNIGGATGASYSPGNLTTTTYYRRSIVSFCGTVYTNTAAVTVYSILTGGSITPASFSISYNTSPGTLAGTSAIGGDGIYTYQWQSSPDNSTWTNINGATAVNYAPGNLTATTYFRKAVTSNGITAYSTISTINVYSQLNAGTIIPASISINYDTSPGQLTGSVPTGGNGSYAYQWQSSPNNSTWADITGATAVSYTPGSLTATTYYRKSVTSNSVTVYSSVSAINVYSALNGGTVDPASASINYNSSPGQLTGSVPTGGNGTYAYQWQSSPNNSTWADITGAAAVNYTPGSLTAATYYRRSVTSNGLTANSSVSIVNVYSALSGGSIIPASLTVNYNTSAGTLAGTSATGGNGIYVYQWQSSADNSTWTGITGATAVNYTTGSLTTTIYYRRSVTSNGVTAYSSVSTINVNGTLNGGTVSPVSANINYSTSPGQLTCNGVAGGNGNYSYQWQSSANNTTWTNITGAMTVNYVPENLTATTYFRNAVTSDGVTTFSSVSTINVYSALNAGTISPVSASINYNTSPGQLTGNAATGGNGIYAYQWQSSADNSIWGDISNVTGLNFTPGNLTAVIYFRRKVTSNGATLYSNTSAISIINTGNISNNYNYIKETVVRDSGIISTSAVGTLTADQRNITYTYMDGLGRPMQIVQQQGSPGKRDIVTPVAYDEYGRENKKYLPYAEKTAGSNGNLKLNALSDQNSFYRNPASLEWNAPKIAGTLADNLALSEILFESSPLNRVLEQGAPGAEWQLSAGHTVRLEYITNNITAFTDLLTTRRVTMYKVNIAADGTRSLAIGSTPSYAANELYVTVTKDENWLSGREGTTEEYKDKEGRVVLKRIFNKKDGALEMLSTYYVYDDFGNLCYVLPPGAQPDAQEAINFPTAVNIERFAYQYRYDHRQRMIEKKLPGILPEYYVYNKLDQKVAFQDGDRRMFAKTWRYFKYDAHGRVIVTGWFGDGSITYSRQNIEELVNADTVLWESRANSGLGYDNLAWPQGTENYYDVNYYDHYNIYQLPGDYTFEPFDENLVASQQARGLLTATLTRSNNSSMRLWKVNYYDNKARLIQVIKKNSLTSSSKDIVKNTYDFIGQLKKSRREHSGTTGQAVTVINDYVYDHAGRRLDVKSQIGAEQVTVAHYEYNELGQLVDKKLHLKTGQSKYLQSLDYRYNSRGWLTSINDPALVNTAVNEDDPGSSDTDKFGMLLNYTGSLKPQYNGNIGSMTWGTTAKGTAGYNFVYDNINRLTEAVSPDHMYDENLRYDAMGNISRLGRWAKIGGVRHQIDSLSYSYTGNKLNDVDDSMTNTYGYKDNGAVSLSDMTYDDNGRMIKDLNKGVSKFRYDGLGLTSGVEFSSGAEIIYDSDRLGVKLKKTVKDAAGATVIVTHYVDGIQYTTQPGGSPILDFIQTEEGRIKKTGNTYIYEYDLKDHLGNTRITVKQSGSDPTPSIAEVIQEDSYYAFGMQMPGMSGLSAENKYLYNGKELQDEYGLNQYDFGARFYDPVTGRFTTVDPLAAHPKQIGVSSYAAFNNNPVRYIDPTGMIWGDPKDAERLNKAVNDRIAGIGKENTKIQTQIDKGGLSEKKLERLQSRMADNNSQVGLLNQSIGDIKAIGEAKETYVLAGTSQSDGRHGVVKDSKGVIQIEGSNTGLHLHEIRHVGQSIQAGGVKFNSKGQLLNSATTKAGGRANEVNAYQVGYSYDGQYPAGASSLKDINPASLMNIKLPDGTPVYEKLKE